MIEEPPEAPTGVRLVEADGLERKATVHFAGYSHDGLARWYVIDSKPGEPFSAVRMDTMPGRSELILPLPGRA
jgi:hypothetical protein